MVDGGVNTGGMGICLGVYQAGETIAGVTSDALASMGFFLVEPDSYGQRKRVKTNPIESIKDFLDAWLMA